MAKSNAEEVDVSKKKYIENVRVFHTYSANG